jgi:hypothetical protein
LLILCGIYISQWTLFGMVIGISGGILTDNKAIFINDNILKEVNKLKNKPGKDIWLYGGASLITTFINLGLLMNLDYLFTLLFWEKENRCLLI